MANAWKIARKSNAQLPLVIVIALAVVLVLLGKAQSGLFDQARMRVTDWMQPVLTKVRAPVQGFDRWMGSISEIFSVYEQNLKLKEENARLRQWRNVAIVLQGRVGRYQTLLHAVPDPKLNTVLARVIGRASRPFLQTMVLDAGRAHRVLPGEAVNMHVADVGDAGHAQRARQVQQRNLDGVHRALGEGDRCRVAGR